jgi:nucleotide-binding universal stress UspA family protein
MISHILVPIDFSECSMNALKYAAQLARKLRTADLVIVHAFTMPLVYGEMGIYASADLLTAKMDEEIEENFRGLSKNIPELKKISFTTLTQQALAVDAILSLCMTTDIDLVVMGTKGASGIDEIIMGTNTYSVIKNTKCPVLVIPKNAQYDTIHNIALASDYKPIESSKLEPLKVLIKVFGSKLHLIHISDKNGIDASMAEEAKKLEHSLKNISHQLNFIINDNVEEGLNSYITQNKIDLLVLVPRKHKLFDMIFGSGESKKIVFHTKTPLLAIPD